MLRKPCLDSVNGPANKREISMIKTKHTLTMLLLYQGIVSNAEYTISYIFLLSRVTWSRVLLVAHYSEAQPISE